MKALFIILILISMMSFGQDVNIPDVNFKEYLVGEPLINTNGDSEIQLSEASSYSGKIDCTNQSISDLTGIEAFTALTELVCRGNQLTSIDISNNTALFFLWCDNNQLTSLDISANVDLTELWCSNNQLTSLDVSTNVALIELLCHYNNITELDISNNPNINHLDATDNQLVCLNANNGNSANIDILYAGSNPNLTCIEVSDFPSVVWILDSQTSLSENCNSTCSNTSIISEPNNTSKKLIKIIDLLGRETQFKPNASLLYIYDDGTVERKKILLYL